MSLEKIKVKISSQESSVHRGLRRVVRSIWPEYSYLPNSEFKFKRFTDGLSNVLYRVTMGSHAVLVRVYGKGTDKMLDRDAEIETQKLLAERGLAAHFYGKFANGCSYEYLHGTPLTVENVGQHCKLIAAEMARWHQATLPLPSLTPCSVQLMDKWLGLLPANAAVWSRSHYSHSLLEREVAYLMGALEDSPLRFCHNDCLAFNILLDDGVVRFIDYEYSGFNARGFDLGNHFNEYLGFDLDVRRYPDRAEQMEFVDAYLEAYYGDAGLVLEQEREHLWREANQWSLVSHLLWAIWGLFQAANSAIDFDFVLYSNQRLAIYYRNRTAFLQKDAADYVYEPSEL